MSCTISIHTADGSLRTCPGPDLYGGCPLATEGGRVPCAGSQVTVQEAASVTRWTISPAATACFLAELQAIDPRPNRWGGSRAA